MTDPKTFLESTAGKASVIALGVVLVIALVWALLPGSPGAALANTRTYIDAETNEPFEHTMRIGEMVPVEDAPGLLTAGFTGRTRWTQG